MLCSPLPEGSPLSARGHDDITRPFSLVSYSRHTKAHTNIPRQITELFLRSSRSLNGAPRRIVAPAFFFFPVVLSFLVNAKDRVAADNNRNSHGEAPGVLDCVNVNEYILPEHNCFWCLITFFPSFFFFLVFIPLRQNYLLFVISSYLERDCSSLTIYHLSGLL